MAPPAVKIGVEDVAFESSFVNETQRNAVKRRLPFWSRDLQSKVYSSTECVPCQVQLEGKRTAGILPGQTKNIKK